MNFRQQFSEAAKDLNAFVLDVVTLPYRAPRELYRTFVAGSSVPGGDKPMTPVQAGLTTAGFQILLGTAGAVGFVQGTETGLLCMAATNVFMNTASGFISFLNSDNPVMPYSQERSEMRAQLALERS